jgi:predicted aspartyl protease
MSIADGRPLVTLAVNGVEVPVLVDTGAPHSVTLAGPRAEAAAVSAREGRRAIDGDDVGVNTVLEAVAAPAAAP